MNGGKLNYGEILIPAGDFLKGITEDQGEALLAHGAAVLPNMKPQLSIYLDSYYIDRYPVTNEQYLDFTLQTGYQAQGIAKWGAWMDHFPDGGGKLPVVALSWADMSRYAGWAGKRLPTEAEWEKASRGIDGRLWPWGNEFSHERCNARENGIEQRTPVDRYPEGQSPFGCFDMAGNVWEIVADWYDIVLVQDASYPALMTPFNPTGPRGGSSKVMKGGAFSTPLANCCCPFRICHDSSTQWNRVGFRCVRNA